MLGISNSWTLKRWGKCINALSVGSHSTMVNRIVASNAITNTEPNVLNVTGIHSVYWKTDARIAHTTLGLLKMMLYLSNAPIAGTRRSAISRRYAAINNVHLCWIRVLNQMKRVKNPRVGVSKSKESLSLLKLQRKWNAINATSQSQMVSIAYNVREIHQWPAPSTLRKISKSAGLAVHSRPKVTR